MTIAEVSPREVFRGRVVRLETPGPQDCDNLSAPQCTLIFPL